MSFITDWVNEKVSGYARTGLQAGGTMAGNAVGGVGGVVENCGKSAGDGVSGAISGVGNYINSYGNSIQRSLSADGPVGSDQKKTAVKQSTAIPKKPQATPTKSSPGVASRKPPASAEGVRKSLAAARGVNTLPPNKTKAVPPSSQKATSTPQRATPAASSRSTGSQQVKNAKKDSTPPQVSKPPGDRLRVNTDSRPQLVTKPAIKPKVDPKGTLGSGNSFGTPKAKTNGNKTSTSGNLSRPTTNARVHKSPAKT